MKYPGLPPAGDPFQQPAAPWIDGLGSSAVKAWSLLGGDVALAVLQIEALADQLGAAAPTPTSVALRLALVEGRRRLNGDEVAGLAAEVAIASAEELGEPVLLVAAYLAASTRAWTVADTPLARTMLEDARSHVGEDAVAGAYCNLAESRLARIAGDPDLGRRLSTKALTTLEDAGDPDGVADARRELAAIALLGGSPSDAGPFATAARSHHQWRGDRYLDVQAGVLEARVKWETDRSGAVDDLGSLAAQARELGSTDLEVVATIHLGQKLQVLCSEDPARWAETDAALGRALELAIDPFSRAEALVARAVYKVRLFRFDDEDLDSDLDEAERQYALVGNPTGLGTVARCRARVSWARSRIQPSRRPALLRRAARSWAEASGFYLAARMPTPARSAFLERLVGQVVLGGELLSSYELETLTSPEEGITPDERGNKVRALLIEAYEALRRDPGSNAKKARKLLREVQAMLRDVPDPQLSVATKMGLAEANLQLNRPSSAIQDLRAGLDDLARFDVALAEPGQRARFVAVAEPLTRQALALAVGARDTETGLRLLEYRRTGRLAGLLRRGRRVTLSPEVSDLLDRLDDMRNRQDAGGIDNRSFERDIGSEWEDCHQALADATSRLFAETYDPAGIDIQAMVRNLPSSSCVLILDRPDPETPDQLVRAIVPAGDLRAAEVEHVSLSSAALTAIESLADAGQLAEVGHLMKSSHLQPLVEPLLGRLGTDLLLPDSPNDLLIIPTGTLWAVPFAALPLGAVGARSVLIEHATITLAPSLRFHDIAYQRPRRRGQGALSWRSPELGSDPALDEHQALDVLGAGHRRALDAAEVRAALTDGGSLDAIAIAGHGINEPGLAHGIRLDEIEALRGADLIDADLPRLLLLGACDAGYSPGSESDEPIGLPTLALCAGAEAVLSPCIELANNAATAEYLAVLYGALLGGGCPSTVHREVTVAWLNDQENRNRPLTDWAAMGVIGTLPPVLLASGGVGQVGRAEID